VSHDLSEKKKDLLLKKYFLLSMLKRSGQVKYIFIALFAI